MKQALSILLTFALLVGIGVLAKGCYKQSVKKEVVSDLQAETTTQEGEAIEKVIQIDRTISNLSDADVDASLLISNDFWPEDSTASKPSERMPSLRRAKGSETRSPKNQASSRQAQQTIPITLPLKDPCPVVDGFDDNNHIISIEVCEDAR